MAGRKQAETEDTARVALQGGRPTVEEANTRAAEAGGPGPTMVTVKQDVYEDVTDPGAVTQRQRLKYHRGQVITEDEAKANKVQAVQQQDVKGANIK